MVQLESVDYFCYKEYLENKALSNFTNTLQTLEPSSPAPALEAFSLGCLRECLVLVKYYRKQEILPFLRICKRMARDGGLLKRCDPGINSFPFHQHLFDFTPLLEQELVLHPAGVVRACNSVGKKNDSLPSPGQEGRSRSSGNIDVRGRPVQQKFGRTGRKISGSHQRCQSQMVLGIWVRTCFQKELNKVEVGHVVPGARVVQGRLTVWDRDSVDVGAVFNKLFC
jgi:hypothetical protein